MGRLDGKIVIITGAARGMGEREARLFAAEGATVHLTDLSPTGADVAADIGGVFHEHDVTDEARWSQVVSDVLAQHGRIDVLVNNAGIFEVAGIVDTDRALWDRMVAVNQTGPHLGMAAVVPTMVSQGSGSIVNISSIAGIRGTEGYYAYSATKWALRGMTRSVAKELARHGVRVNSIHPGIIDTPMAQVFDDAGVRDAVRSRIPFGREADASEVASVALFLASDESSYCSGSEFVVDGAMTA